MNIQHSATEPTRNGSRFGIAADADRVLTVGALPAGVPKLPAEIAGPLAQFVGAVVLRVSLATTSEATHRGLLKVLIKIPACTNAHSQCSHILHPQEAPLLLRLCKQLMSCLL